MTAPTIEQLPVRIPGHTPPPDLVHVSCCIDDGEIALCGTDITNDLWVSRATSTSCVVCADLDDVIRDSGTCKGVCPLIRGNAS